jgi:uncharacterized protein YegJ (DUF2314 family)
MDAKPSQGRPTRRPSLSLRHRVIGGRPVSRGYVAAVVFALVLAGCGTKQLADKVTYLPDDDPRMNAAIVKARATVSGFITALKSPQPNQSAFSIKMMFTDGSQAEHMWLSSVSYDGANFKGTVDNEPDSVKTVKLGQTVTVSPAEISDWMYVENGKLVGGQTLRVLRDVSTPAERAEFDKNVPFIVE